MTAGLFLPAFTAVRLTVSRAQGLIYAGLFLSAHHSQFACITYVFVVLSSAWPRVLVVGGGGGLLASGTGGGRLACCC